MMTNPAHTGSELVFWIPFGAGVGSGMRDAAMVESDVFCRGFYRAP